jgi:hypothetical protein
MMGGLTVLSALLWWLLYASLGALVCSVIVWPVLRWSERQTVVFNRTYFACLLWNLLAMALLLAAAWHAGALTPPYASLLAADALRWALVAQMMGGALLLWRLIPRRDARRIRPGSACLAAALVTAVAYGAATSLIV